ILVGKADIVAHFVGERAAQHDRGIRITGWASEQIVLNRVHVRSVVQPSVPTRRMIGIEARSAILPSHVALQNVTNAGVTAARFETIAVAGRGLAGTTVAIAVLDRPAVFDQHRHLLLDQIVSVIGIEPGATAADDRAGAGHLVVHAEAVGVLTVPLAAVLVIVVV